MLWTTPACFSTSRFTTVPTLVENFQFLNILYSLLITDWWTHAFHIIRFHTPQLYLRMNTVLCHPITQQYESRTVWKAPLHSSTKLIKIIKVATKKSMDNFHCAKEAIMQNQCFLPSAKMNRTQRRTLLKNALHIVWYAKRHLWCQTVKKSSP